MVLKSPGRSGQKASTVGVLDVQGRPADDHPIAAALLSPGDPLGREPPELAPKLFSNALRSDLSVSRWRDPVWLAWLVVPMLMAHMFEEYGFDILGRTYLLRETLCKNLGYPAYLNCPVPVAHYPMTAKVASAPPRQCATSRRSGRHSDRPREESGQAYCMVAAV
jgi:hypothetical protein